MSVLASTEPRLASGGSVSATPVDPFRFYKKIYSRKTLRSAWRVVYGNGIASEKEETRRLVKEFSVDIETHLERIYRQLLKDKFTFMAAEGILIPRKGKTPRPLVKSPIPNRIVQRAILEVLQADPNLEPFYKNPSSFGGIKGRRLGVPGAVKAVYEAITSGLAKYYIRSDIPSFFTKIPRRIVLEKISRVIPDEKFQAILEKATDVELANLARLGSAAALFPSYEVGVAQGCCLSPLLGNILLEDFDHALNGRGIACIRYIDDFIILGPDGRKVEAAFNSGLKMLARYGLAAYDPKVNKDKADAGEVSRGLEFLGCNIRPGMISPTRKSRQRIIDAVKLALDKSFRLMDDPERLWEAGLGAVDSLADVSHMLQGWGNQYAFCNDREVLKAIDSEVNGHIENYWRAIARRYSKFTSDRDIPSSRRLLGVHLLTDSKFDPIVDSVKKLHRPTVSSLH
jgi:retron-type reverse transcriptase